MKVITAEAPQWASSDSSSINLWVTFEGLGRLPFTASKDDTEAHGRELFVAAKAGRFGPVAPFVEDASAGQ